MFIKKFKALKDKKTTTAVPVLARKMAVAS